MKSCCLLNQSSEVPQTKGQQDVMMQVCINVTCEYMGMCVWGGSCCRIIINYPAAHLHSLSQLISQLIDQAAILDVLLNYG